MILGCRLASLQLPSPKSVQEPHGPPIPQRKPRRRGLRRRPVHVRRPISPGRHLCVQHPQTGRVLCPLDRSRGHGKRCRSIYSSWWYVPPNSQYHFFPLLTFLFCRRLLSRRCVQSSAVRGVGVEQDVLKRPRLRRDRDGHHPQTTNWVR